MATLQSNPSFNEIEELTISVQGNNLNPVMLSYEFLTSSGVVPRSWELAKQPVLNQRSSQIAFKNGLGIVAQPGVINFVEAVNGRNLEELYSPKVIAQYIEKLPHADYQRLTISPKLIVPLSNDESDSSRKFITGVLLAPGAWQDFGTAPVQAALTLTYQLENSVFNLGINEARLQLPDESTLPGLLFAGNFNYNVSGETDDDRVAMLKKQLECWRGDLKTFREVVHQKFLQMAEKTETSLFPVV